MLPIAQKLYVLAKSDLCEMYKFFIHQYAKGVRLLDKMAIFVYTGIISGK